jgi:hypothetical protein
MSELELGLSLDPEVKKPGLESDPIVEPDF